MLLPHILSTLLLLIVQATTDDLPCVFSPNNVTSTKRSCNKFNHTDGPVVVNRRQAGRSGLGGCGNTEIKSIMERVMPPLLNVERMKIGDIAKRLQAAVQQATGKSYEIFMGKGDMQIASHQMEDGTSCKQRVGEFFTTVYETPVQYDIANLDQEQFFSNIDFGEPLGGSGYPGQERFPHLVRTPGEAGTDALGEADRAGLEQAGRANAEPDGGPRVHGCENALLSGIMNRVVPPLLNAPQRMRIGDIARTLQLAVQQETGRSFEVFMGRTEMTFSSHQISPLTSCRMRIGEYYTDMYETPVQYNIFDAAEEQFMANIDFGQELGSTGYLGQILFPQYTELVPLDAPLQGPLWPQYYPPVADLVYYPPPPAPAPPPPVFAQMECFSAGLMVETVEGPKRMDELKTGDEVLSIDESMISFSPIIMFLHRDEDLRAEFNVITTANGKSVKLTNEHLIFVSDCDIKNPLRPVKAKEVTTDDCVISSQTSRRVLNVDRVTNVTKVYERGIFSPLTSTGDIIVNDILSSCHSNLGVRTLQQSVFAVYQSLYRSLSFFLPEEGSFPVGLSYLISTLDLFLPVKATIG